MKDPCPRVQGECSDRFAPVRKLFQEHLDRDVSTGAALCVFLQGKPVVDLYGGFKDEAKQERWEADTIVNVYSSTKAWTGMA